MNAKKVPQLFVATGATKWNDPKDFPWTMGWQPSYQSEARIYAKYILKEKPNAKIAVLYQNDDYGKDYLKGLKDGLGEKAASMIVAEESYETTEPTIDNQIVRLKAPARTSSLISRRRSSPRRRSRRSPKSTGSRCTFSTTFRLTSARHQAGRLRKCTGHHFGGLRERCLPTRNGTTIPA